MVRLISGSKSQAIGYIFRPGKSITVPKYQASIGEGVGIFSVNGQYTFGLQNPRKVKPFVTGGYSLAFRQGTVNAINFGGGIHYWFRDRLGLRLEFRDYLSPEMTDVHLWQGWIGIEFR